MAKHATKAAGNVFYLARKEAETRNDHLGSREGVQEETGIDRTRLARIESGVLNPYPEEVLLLAQLYDAPQLCNHYCSQLCPLGQKTIPPCELLQIDRLTIKVLHAMKEAEGVEDDMVDIVQDGVITDDELPRLEEITTRLAAIEKASMELRMWIPANRRDLSSICA